jgi:hypothetical protein
MLELVEACKCDVISADRPEVDVNLSVESLTLDWSCPSIMGCNGKISKSGVQDFVRNALNWGDWNAIDVHHWELVVKERSDEGWLLVVTGSCRHLNIKCGKIRTQKRKYIHEILYVAGPQLVSGTVECECAQVIPYKRYRGTGFAK